MMMGKKAIGHHAKISGRRKFIGLPSDDASFF